MVNDIRNLNGNTLRKMSDGGYGEILTLVINNVVVWIRGSLRKRGSCC
jgi:hypothetical protein